MFTGVNTALTANVQRSKRGREREITAAAREGVGASSAKFRLHFSHWILARSFIGNKMSEITLEPLGTREEESSEEQRRGARTITHTTHTLTFLFLPPLLPSAAPQLLSTEMVGAARRHGWMGAPNNKTGRSGPI